MTRAGIAAALGGVAALALLAPIAALVGTGEEAPPPPARAIAPLAPQAPPDLADALARPLFAGDGAGGSRAGAQDAAAGAPRLVGIVGRLGGDAVAMIRGSDGVTRTLGIGDTVDGWRLESVARDAALIRRGGERRRIELPVEGDADPAGGDRG